MSQHWEWINPWFFWFLVLLPLLFYWLYHNIGKERPFMRYSMAGILSRRKTWRNRLWDLTVWFLPLVLLMMIVAGAGPRNVESGKRIKKTKGIDIILAVDVSGSMLAKDFKPNRLEALKRTAIDFIRRRPNDRIGLVVYAGEAFTKVPLTTDKRIVENAIRKINFQTLSKQIDQGTAIGMGLAVAVNRLKDSKAKSKVIILMTDGVNNTGAIDPETALELAKQFGIKVYTIGIGTNGVAPMPLVDRYGNIVGYSPQKVEIDERLLKKIAKETGGQYYRATNSAKLKRIYDEIDKLEKTVIEETRFYNYSEWFRPFVWIALLLLSIIWIIRQIILPSKI